MGPAPCCCRRMHCMGTMWLVMHARRDGDHACMQVARQWQARWRLSSLPAWLLPAEAAARWRGRPSPIPHRRARPRPPRTLHCHRCEWRDKCLHACSCCTPRSKAWSGEVSKVAGCMHAVAEAGLKRLWHKDGPARCLLACCRWQQSFSAKANTGVCVQCVHTERRNVRAMIYRASVGREGRAR